MTSIEELALHLFGQLRDGDLKRSDIELIEDAIGKAYEDGKADTDASLRSRLEASEKADARHIDYYMQLEKQIVDLEAHLATVTEARNQLSLAVSVRDTQLTAWQARVREVEEALKYLADENSWSVEDGSYQMKRPGGSQRAGIFLSSHFLNPWVYAKLALTPTTPAAEEEAK